MIPVAIGTLLLTAFLVYAMITNNNVTADYSLELPIIPASGSTGRSPPVGSVAPAPVAAAGPVQSIGRSAPAPGPAGPISR